VIRDNSWNILTMSSNRPNMHASRVLDISSFLDSTLSCSTQRWRSRTLLEFVSTPRTLVEHARSPENVSRDQISPRDRYSPLLRSWCIAARRKRVRSLVDRSISRWYERTGIIGGQSAKRVSDWISFRVAQNISECLSNV